MDLFTVEYFSNNKWNFYSGTHKNKDSAICNASVVSNCRRCSARIMLNGVESEEVMPGIGIIR